MAGYLDRYGEGDERREKIVKATLLTIFIVLVVGAGLFFMFRNYKQEQRVRAFLDLLNKQDYRAAYALWGCTEENPCRDYSFDNFMEDWGPKSTRGAVGSYRISRSRSCGSGVVLTIETGDKPEYLWVEKRDLTIGFSPYPGCPNL